MKCVMIIDSELPVGLQINTAAGLGISLAGTVQGLVGPNTADADGNGYEGIVNIPVPILGLKKDELKGKYLEIKEKMREDLRLFVFSDVAQRSLSYAAYEAELRSTAEESVQILGLCLYGSPKSVSRFSGSIKTLR